MKRATLFEIAVLTLAFAAFGVFATQKRPIINGFFVQPSLGYGVADYAGAFHTQEYYDGWVKSMADIGATMLFYQWVAHYEENQTWFTEAFGGSPSADFCFYDPDLTQISGVPVNSWMPAIENWTGESVSPVKRVLDAGEKNGVKVWLGLYLSEKGQFNWWNATKDNEINAEDLATFTYHVERSVDLVRDLAKQYASHPAFGGFYYPIEIANLGFEKEENWQTLAWLLDEVAAEVHRRAPGKRLAVSPFFNVALTPAQEWGRMWDYVLANSAIDIVMLQDGVGVEPHILTENVDLVSPYFAAVKAACDNNGKSFWANSELFTNTSGDRGRMEAAPASIDKILLQINAQAQFADTFVCFSYLSLDPFVAGLPGVFNADYPLASRKKLYEDYKAYWKSVKNENANSINAPFPRLNASNLKFSLTSAGIEVSGLQKPANFRLISPNGRVAASGEITSGTAIKSHFLASGIYILTLTGAQFLSPVNHKFFINNNIQNTLNYQLRSW